MQEFTKEQAIEAMMKGEKMTHRFFSDHEWATMQGGMILLEDGVKCHPMEFWAHRKDKFWEDGWSKWEEPAATPEKQADLNLMTPAEQDDQVAKQMTNFQILEEMTKHGKALRMSPHFVSAQGCKGGGLVTMGVDNDTLLDLIRPTLDGKPKYMLQLFVIDLQHYKQIRDNK